MKTRIEKPLSGILAVILASAALMQLFCAQLELKYTRQALAAELKSEARLLAMNHQRTRRQAEKIAELETRLRAMTGGKTGLTGDGPAAAAHF